MSERQDPRADACLTCSDEALPALVLRLTGSGLAVVRVRGTACAEGAKEAREAEEVEEQVSVALVDCGPGDTVLVHAKEAIAVIAKGGGADDGQGHG
ncbi:hydrogenase assembly protein HupF [Sphaerisporangium sp. NPDC051011]|uniref:hydrogenase assembly protein HupF n=1 Tax=Sphaerisporangium sp. NPDC051011 TaxID=3155792 RepID=UPI0033F63FE1